MTDIQRRILKEEYPTMSFDSDSDIERYFEMRKQGRQADALALYDTRLRKKYPNDAQRTELLRFYRSRDPRYAEILRESMIDLAERLVVRTTYVISLLTKDIDSVDLTDAYSVIKLTEGLLSVISPDRYVAISFTEKYVRYAKALNYRHGEMERTAELIRLYVTDTIESVQDFKKEREERRKQRARQTARQREDKRANFDLSRIVFSDEDLRRIAIPENVTRTEDIVIAYCMKYWNLVGDPAFEKTVFLYSRKYHTKNNDVFQAIKNGRDHGWKDEEILNAVLATVVTGYYYSITGDVYLQRSWARSKAGLVAGGEGQEQAQTPIALPQPRANPRMTTYKAKKWSAPKTAPKSAHRIALATHTTRTVAVKAAQSPAKPALVDKSIRQTVKVAPAKVTSVKVAPVKASAPIAKAKVTAKAATRAATFKPEKTPARARRPKLPAAPAFKPNSVADMIRKMTGKTYTVYKDLFFREIRPSIRATLAASRSGRANPFGSKQNDAEEIMYGFLEAHYDDPYQNWKGSVERKAVEDLGYAMPALEPVISDWIEHKK
jgi:hypothetical protein